MERDRVKIGSYERVTGLPYIQPLEADVVVLGWLKEGFDETGIVKDLPKIMRDGGGMGVAKLADRLGTMGVKKCKDWGNVWWGVRGGKAYYYVVVWESKDDVKQLVVYEAADEPEGNITDELGKLVWWERQRELVMVEVGENADTGKRELRVKLDDGIVLTEERYWRYFMGFYGWLNSDSNWWREVGEGETTDLEKWGRERLVGEGRVIQLDENAKQRMREVWESERIDSSEVGLGWVEVCRMVGSPEPDWESGGGMNYQINVGEEEIGMATELWLTREKGDPTGWFLRCESADGEVRNVRLVIEMVEV